MEEKQNIKEEILDINKFFQLYSNVASAFFINLFKDTIKSIIINKEKNDPIFIFINIIFNKNTANYFNIVHGGSIAILFENINILYKRQVSLNIEYELEIKIEKIKYKTVFIHCRLYKKQNKEESTEANIIAEKEIINKI